ncbi:hypothetical protein QJQ45_005331 [Haematococcus lacustris]|nr:hypothetical protein QJQ45_005331 [Haematococcus lacustris]
MQQGLTAPLSSAKHKPTTALARTCHAFSKASLLHAPAFRIQLDSQRYDQLLTPRIITALRTRTTKLAIILDQRQKGSEDGYGQYCELLVTVLSKLGSCPAVEACKLFSCDAQCDGGPHSGGVSGSDSEDEQPNGRLTRSSEGKATQPPAQSARLSDSGDDSGSCADSGSDNGSGSGSADDSGSDTDTKEALDCSPGLAQHLLDSFPGLTALSLHGFSITCSGLASLLSHPQLSPQLQQLDLTHSALQEPDEEPDGAVSWTDLMHGVKLKQLSLHTSGYDPFLPNMQPLGQCLTQLHVMELGKEYPELEGYTDALRPLTLLEVLRVDGVFDVDLTSLSRMLQALPRLHSLLLPHTRINGSQELDALLAATQLTRIMLDSVQELTSSHAQAPCSWQQLVLTGCIDAYTASCLPLHFLTHTFELNSLSTTSYTNSSRWSVAAQQSADAVHNLTQCCKVAVKVEVLELWVSDISRGLAHTLQRVKEQVALLHPLSRCCDKVVKILYLPELSAASVQVLAPLCQHCICLEFQGGHLTPSLGLWRQLVQLMPSVQQVRFTKFLNATGADMCESLQQLAKQPWAQCLHINIRPLPGALSHPLPACWQALITPSKPGNFRVSLGGRRQRE